MSTSFFSGCIPKWRYKFLFLRVQRSHSLPLQFLATDHWPLSTALSKSGPAVPCKRLRNVLYCKVEPEHIRATPERAACAQLPAHHAQAANYVDLLRSERPQPAPSAHRSGRSRYHPEMYHPSVRRTAHSQQDETRHPAHACAAATRLGILSRKGCNCRRVAHFLHQNDRELTATVSCYESPCPYPVTRRPKNFSKLDQTGQNKQFDTLSIPCRYPISQKFAATLRHNTTLLGQLWTDSAAYLTACAASPTRRLTPPPTSTLTPARADAMARNEVLYSPKRPGASIPAVVKSAARTRVQQRMKQEGICRYCDGAHAVLARRARRPSQRPRENPF